MSSLGDIIHTFPAITDLVNHYKKQKIDVQIDWLVEEAFSQIIKWHPNVSNVIPIALRRWRKNISINSYKELKICIKTIRHNKYDVIIDAQGLFKSAVFSRLAAGKNSFGFDRMSARETIASYLYKHKISVTTKLHAILRIKQLFAKSFGYTYEEVIDYGLAKHTKPKTNKYIMFCHGTTWQSKHWPEKYWQELAKLCAQQKITVRIPCYNNIEKQRADSIASNANSKYIKVLEKMSLEKMKSILEKASLVIAVDTGLGHLAAALNTPTILLYSATDPSLTSPISKTHITMQHKLECSPCKKRVCIYKTQQQPAAACFDAVTPKNVLERITQLL